MNWLWLLAGLLIGGSAGALVMALISGGREKNVCSGCEIWENHDSDYSHCFNCKRGVER